MVKKWRILKNYSLTPQKRKSNNLSGKNLTFGVQISKIMEIVVLIANFDRVNLIVFVVGVAFSAKILNWAVMEVRSPTLEACIGETICRMLFTREKLQSVKLAGAPIVCGSEPVMGALENSTSNNHSSVGSSSDKCVSVTLEIRPRMLLKRMFKSLVMFCLVSVSLLSRQTLKCLNLKLPSHVNMAVLKISSDTTIPVRMVNPSRSTT